MARITKRTVDALQADAFVWDRSFGVKATRAGRKFYVLGYRIGRRRRRLTIGEHGAPWTPDTARKEAERLLGLIRAGHDPLATKAAARVAPTVREVAARFMREHVEAKRKASTARTYRGYLENDVLPVLGALAVTDVTRADLARLHHALRATPAHANRVVMMCSKLFTLAERWGLRADGSNPCRHVEKYREQARERYLGEAEWARLGDALTTADREPIPVPGEAVPRRLSPFALAAIRLLIFTGARRGEILTLQWEHVDLERGVLSLPDSKTGRKPIFLNAPACAVLATLPRVESNPYVIVGARADRPLVNVAETWGAVRALAGLKDVRLHDLRHSHASVGASAGLSLPVIGGLLGHTQAQTTQRYAHLAADPLKQAAELVGTRIAAAMAPIRSASS